MRKLISCFKLLSAPLGKSKWIAFDSVIITSLLFLMITSIVITTWLNCCKVFWCFYCVEKLVKLFVSFFGLYELFIAFVCANNTRSLVNDLFGVKIWFLLFLEVLLHHLLVVTGVVYWLVIYLLFQTILYNHLYQVLNW